MSITRVPIYVPKVRSLGVSRGLSPSGRGTFPDRAGREQDKWPTMRHSHNQPRPQNFTASKPSSGRAPRFLTPCSDTQPDLNAGRPQAAVCCATLIVLIHMPSLPLFRYIEASHLLSSIWQGPFQRVRAQAPSGRCLGFNQTLESPACMNALHSHRSKVEGLLDRPNGVRHTKRC